MQQGLANFGNTCFFNSVCQLICRYDGKIDDKTPFTKMINMLKMGKCTRDVHVKALRYVFQKYPMFASGQHDAQELLIKLLEDIHETTHSVKNFIIRKHVEPSLEADLELESIYNYRQDGFSILGSSVPKDKIFHTDIFNDFTGQMAKCIKCSACGHKTYNFQCFKLLNVKPCEEDLKKCIESLHVSEDLPGYKCDKCKQTKCSMTTYIWRLPKYLLIYINRFNGYMSNVRETVSIPDELDLSESTIYDRGLSTKYSIVSSINHVGGLRGGHYYNVLKTDDGVTIIDDTRISPLKIPFMGKYEVILLYSRLE